MEVTREKSTVCTAGGKGLSRPTSYPDFSRISLVSGTVFHPQRRCLPSETSAACGP